MTPNEYQKEALRTASGMSKEYPDYRTRLGLSPMKD